jgi:amino acid transporter
MSEKVFLRKASGLVRDLNAFDAFVANTTISGPIGLNIAYGVFWALFALPGGDLVTAVAIGTFLSIWHVAVYAMFSSTYPRSGGDYLFLSRSLHPAIGFMASVNFLFFEAIFFGLVLYWFGQICISAPFAVMGFALNNQALIDAGTWAASTGGIFVLGTLFIILLGLITTVGVKVMFRLNDIFFILGLIGIAIAVGGLAFSSNAAFIANFNSMMNQYTGSSNSYQWFLDTAKSLDLSLPAGYDWSMTLGMIAVGTSSTCWGFFSSFMAGEIKKADSAKRQLGIMIGPTILNGLLMMAGLFVLFNTIGYDFMASAFWIWTVFPDQYPLPIPPFSNFLMAILYGNPVIQFIVAVTFTFWPFVIMIPAMMLSTRYIFSWSFDRLTPASLGRVSQRYHTPVYATLVSCILYWLVLAGVAYSPALVFPVLAASSMYIWVGNVALTSITAIFFPWRKKEVYEASPIRNIKVGPIPFISLAGVIAVIVCAFNAYLYLSFPSLGLGPWENALYIYVGAAVIGLLLYFVATQYRKRTGMPVELAFKEIPPA